MPTVCVSVICWDVELCIQWLVGDCDFKLEPVFTDLGLVCIALPVGMHCVLLLHMVRFMAQNDCPHYLCPHSVYILSICAVYILCTTLWWLYLCGAALSHHTSLVSYSAPAEVMLALVSYSYVASPIVSMSGGVRMYTIPLSQPGHIFNTWIPRDGSERVASNTLKMVHSPQNVEISVLHWMWMALCAYRCLVFYVALAKDSALMWTE